MKIVPGDESSYGTVQERLAAGDTRPLKRRVSDKGSHHAPIPHYAELPEHHDAAAADPHEAELQWAQTERQIWTMLGQADADRELGKLCASIGEDQPQGEVTNATTTANQLQGQLNVANQQLAAAEAAAAITASQLQGQLNDAKQKLTAVQAAAATTANELQGKLNVAKQQLAAAQAAAAIKASQLQGQLNDANKQLAAVRAAAVTTANKLLGRLNTAKKQLAAAQAAAPVTANQLQDQLNAADQQLAASRSAAEAEDASWRQLQRELSESQQSVLRLQSDLKASRQFERQVAAQRIRFADEAAAGRASKQQLEQQVAALSNRVAHEVARIEQLQKQLHATGQYTDRCANLANGMHGKQNRVLAALHKYSHPVTVQQLVEMYFEAVRIINVEEPAAANRIGVQAPVRGASRWQVGGASLPAVSAQQAPVVGASKQQVGSGGGGASLPAVSAQQAPVVGAAKQQVGC